MSSKQSPDKPFYQKWWFWVIIVVVVAICGGALNNTNQHEPENEVVTSSADNTIQPDDSTQKNEIPHIGTATQANGLEFIVKSVDRNYVANYSNPKDGMEYVKVNISIKNASKDIQSYNALHFKIEDSNGSIETYANAMMAQADDSLKHGDLAIGGTKEGSIVFEVPYGDTGLKLHIYKNGFDSDIINTIELHD